MDFEEKYNKVKEQFEEARRKRKKKIIIISIISILAIASILIYFIILNKDFTYNLNGESESFNYSNMIITKSDNYYLLTFGELTYKKDNIQNIDYTTIQCEERLIIGASRVLTGTHREKIGYDELFPKEVIKNMDKWEIIIKYTTTDNQQKEETINLIPKRIEN